MEITKNTEIPFMIRPPSQVMKLDRLGSFHQCRISFMRQLLRRINSEKWTYARQLWKINKEGYGQGLFSGMLNKYRLKLSFMNDGVEVNSLEI